MTFWCSTSVSIHKSNNCLVYTKGEHASDNYLVGKHKHRLTFRNVYYLVNKFIIIND